MTEIGGDMRAIAMPDPLGRPLSRKNGRSVIPAIASGWLGLILFIGIFAGWISPHDPNQADLLIRLLPPAWSGGEIAYVLGTDNVGRDVLSRLLHATQLSIFIALLGTVTGAIIGTTLGFVAAHFRGWLEDLIMALVDFQAAVPFLIVAIAVIAFLGTSFEILLALTCIFGWERFARLSRSLALSIQTETYIAAARTYGTRPARLYRRHILPNTAAVLLVNITLTFPETVLLESSLSFLGLGVQPPNASLGTMLSQGRDYLINAWWIAIPPGIMIFLTTLSMSLAGDWLRDRFENSGRI